MAGGYHGGSAGSLINAYQPGMSHSALSLTAYQAPRSFTRRRLQKFVRSRAALEILFFTAFLFTGIIVYVTILSPPALSWRFLDQMMKGNARGDSIPDDPSSPSHPSPVSDVLTLEQIRDIVAPTRGFFSRDYSLYLGWNNMRYIIEAALLQAELLNRTLVLPSFLYARACEYKLDVCADYVPMVDKAAATGKYGLWAWRPIDEHTGFRIPISLIVNMTHLRNRQPVITVSEYLRLHGQDPESESSKGTWLRQLYHTHPNVFETNTSKTPSLFIIQSHWYNPEGTTRVDYIPEAMKRGNLERHPGPHNYDGNTEYWPPLEPTELSRSLVDAMLSRGSPLDWDAAKDVLVNSSHLVGDVKLDDDEVVEKLLNAHDWEVLHTFPTVGSDFAKIIVGHLKQVVPRSSIRGFKDDYHDVDADVLVLAGETHVGNGPGALRFTEALARKRYAGRVVHSLIPPQKVYDLAETLSSRMRQRTEGRMWMGAHMRRGDFISITWTPEEDAEAHARLVKGHLNAGRALLVDLHDHGNMTTWDIDDVQPDPEQTTLLPPRAEDPFFVATDERDPDARREIADAGAIFVYDLLTIEDRRAFGWTLMLSDVVALIEQQVLIHSNFFYGHRLSSFAGSVVNMRAARGADPRTMILD